MLKMFADINRFWEAVRDVRPQKWNTLHIDIHEDDFFVVKCFRKGTNGTARFVNPPMAGHHSNIAERVVRLLLENTEDSVFAVEWKEANRRTRDHGIANIVDSVGVAMELITEYHPETHMIGLCQGGWANAIWAALNPHMVASLTVAGTPIDFKIDGGKCQTGLMSM